MHLHLNTVLYNLTQLTIRSQLYTSVHCIFSVVVLVQLFRIVFIASPGLFGPITPLAICSVSIQQLQLLSLTFSNSQQSTHHEGSMTRIHFMVCQALSYQFNWDCISPPSAPFIYLGSWGLLLFTCLQSSWLILFASCVFIPLCQWFSLLLLLSLFYFIPF